MQNAPEDRPDICESVSVAFFGGVFSPPSREQVDTALEFLNASGCERLVVMPTRSHAKVSSTYSAADLDRLNMCRIAFEGDSRFDGRCEVSDYEMRQRGGSYTYLTLRMLKSSGARVCMLIGDSALATFEKWKNYLEIAEDTEIFVATDTASEQDILRAEAMAQALRQECGAKITVMKNATLPRSMQGVREALSDERCGARAVGESVYEYIKSRFLYGVRTDNVMEKFSEDALARLRKTVEGLMSPKRFSHTLGVEKKAEELCRIFAPEKTGKMRAAALLHDITKELSVKEQFDLCDRYKLPVSDDCLAVPKLLHSVTAAALIEDRFAEFADPELVHAVSVHTMGDENMNICDKILYLADYIEDTRTFSDCVELRAFFDERIKNARTDEDREEALRETLILSFDMTIRNILDSKRTLALTTVRSRNSMFNCQTR